MADYDFAAISPHERYNLIIGLVAPRPIALVTSLDASGRVNAAPYSAFNYACVDPVLVTLGVSDRPGERDPQSGRPTPKDTAQNIRARGEFVGNVVDEAIAEAIISAAHKVCRPIGKSEAARMAAFRTCQRNKRKMQYCYMWTETVFFRVLCSSAT